MRGIILMLIILAAAPMILVRPHLGILFWSWISYMNPHRFTWDVAFLPYAAIVGGVTIVGWIISKEKKLPPSDVLSSLLIFWCAWITLTTILAVYPDTAYSDWNRAFKILLMAILTVVIMNGQERINALVWVIVLSIGFFGVKGGIFSIITGGEYRVYGPEESFMEDNNALAVALLMIVPLMRYLQIQTQNKVLKYALLVAMILCLISVIASYSRGGFLTLAVVVFFLAMKSKNRIVFGGLMIGVVCTAVLFAPEKWTERMNTVQSYEEDNSAQQRLHAWKWAYNTAKESPVFGGGFTIFRDNNYSDFAGFTQIGESGYQNAHSIYFEVLAAHGFVGLFIFLSLGFVGYFKAGSIVRKCRDDPNLKWAADLASMLQISIVSFAIGGAFLNLAFFDLPYHIIGLVVLASEVAKKSSYVPRPGEVGVART